MCGAALTAHECLLNMMAAVHVLLLHEARLVCSGRLEVCGHSRRCAELREVGKDIDIERVLPVSPHTRRWDALHRQINLAHWRAFAFLQKAANAARRHRRSLRGARDRQCKKRVTCTCHWARSLDQTRSKTVESITSSAFLEHQAQSSLADPCAAMMVNARGVALFTLTALH